jgi:hypothetical protein
MSSFSFGRMPWMPFLPEIGKQFSYPSKANSYSACERQ